MSDLKTSKRKIEQLLNAGRLQEARRLGERLCASHPGDADAWYLKGMAEAQSNAYDAAVRSFERVLALAPNDAVTHYNLARIHRAQGRFEEAVAGYRAALRVQPDIAEAHNNLGELLREQGDYGQAEGHFRRALEINPKFIAAYLNLANTQRQKEDYAAARTVLDRALAIAANDADVHMTYGNVAKDEGVHEEALRHFERAVALRPEYAQANFNCAVTLQELGRLEEARAAFRAALKFKPDYGEAYRQLAWGRTGDAERAADVAAMERLWNAPGTDEEDRMHLAFGLGKVAEDNGDFEEAFHYFAAGNRLKRAHIRYDITRDADRTERLMAVFNAEFFAARGEWGCADATPIVIVGMPRSGTSLAEQILASHPRVAGAGELRDLERVVQRTLPGLRRDNFPEGVLGLDRDAFTKLGETYVARLRAHGGEDVAHVTDKMPGNFALLGMLRVMLPRARVIHCRRNALDTCWSIYKQFFGEGQRFAYDLEELGHYYRLYQRLMNHWATVLPGYVLEFDYESIIADLEGATRRLLEFCGLEWDERCLDFHRTERVVKTASVAQVRRPVYSSSVGIGEKYAPYLGPLIKALEGREARDVKRDESSVKG